MFSPTRFNPAPPRKHHLPRVFIATAVAHALTFSLAATAAAAPTPLVVDPAHVGGRCADTRGAAQVTPATPLCRVSAALKLAGPGQSVLLRRGWHSAANVTGVVGSPDQPVDVGPWPGEGSSVSSNGIALVDSRDVRIHGLKVKSLQARMSDRIEFSGNNLKSVYLRATVGARVLRNLIHDPGKELPAVMVQGIGRETRDLVVSDNRIWGLTNDGIDVYNGAAGVRIERNEISLLTLAPGSLLHVDAIQLLPGSDYTVADNYIHDAIHGILVSGGLTSNLRMTGNRLQRVGGNPVQLFGTPDALFCGNTVLEKTAGIWALSLLVAHDGMARSGGVVVGNNDIGHWRAEAETLAPPSMVCPTAPVGPAPA